MLFDNLMATFSMLNTSKLCLVVVLLLFFCSVVSLTLTGDCKLSHPLLGCPSPYTFYTFDSPLSFSPVQSVHVTLFEPHLYVVVWRVAFKCSSWAS